jgi:hypothetical protein
MARKTTTPRDPNLEEIDRWAAAIGVAQLATIRENPDLHPAERQAALERFLLVRSTPTMVLPRQAKPPSLGRLSRT